ncbi:MAG: sensor histidine kinase [Segetibacter sp.]|nr:sensor histidine kinase [Segetibacter sp.]
MQLWKKYKQLVHTNILSGSDHEVMGLSYWRDRLFVKIIMYMVPVSLVALLPGVTMSIIGGVPFLAVIDTLTASIFLAIAVYPGLSLPLRKSLFIICLYFLSIALLLYLGSLGPGLLYLLALTILITLVFSVTIALLSIAINIVIIVLSGLLIHFKLFDSPLTSIYTLGSWIAVSSNLIFLSAVAVASLRMLFNGLEATILQADKLQKQLLEESTSLERALRSMETKNQELEQFAYIASHDLQEPLRTITSVVDLFEKEYKGRLDNDAHNYLDFLSQSAGRMRALITALLDYARIGKEKEMEFVNCNELLQEVIVDLSAQITKNEAHIIIDSLPSLPAYRVELKQLFQNLISNAIKFRLRNTKPQVSVSVKENSDHWKFSVMDNGIGIEAKYQEKIFRIFQRMHPKSKYDGLGIGLSHCKKIVDLHGGKIWVNSEPGMGSIFYFTIPKT